MLNLFLFVGLPYAALIIFAVGCVYRYRHEPFSYSALSSQFLENKKLLAGSIAWHAGLGIILIGHLIPFLFPGVWQGIVSNHDLLVAVEVFGWFAAAVCFLGGVILLVRRVMDSKVQSVTSVMDLVILALLIAQVLLGILTAVLHRWGAAWSTQTVVPYLHGLFLFKPKPEFVYDMPVVIQAHLVLAWVILLLFPFSRLVHALFLPFRFLVRPPQKVVWTNSRRVQLAAISERKEESRRYFLKSALGLTATATLLSMGTLDKLFRFFNKQHVSQEEEAVILEQRVKRLKMTAQERELELERLQSDFIPVASLAELSAKKGKYFIDYQMRPALAFLGDAGAPILISAKCTHLGCTVGSEVDSQNRILCPCHVSFFDIRTGQPNVGAPATVPLPHLGWVLMDAKNQVVASQAPGKAAEGTWDREHPELYRVLIAKQFEKGLA